MNLSIEHLNDPVLGPLCRRAIILFNGHALDRVVEADEEQGYVIVHERWPDGQLKVFGDRLVQLKLIGKVRIIDPDEVDLAEVYLK